MGAMNITPDKTAAASATPASNTDDAQNGFILNGASLGKYAGLSG